MLCAWGMKQRLILSLFLVLVAVVAGAKDFTVVIDAGHGGKDPGALSANGKIREKDITLHGGFLSQGLRVFHLFPFCRFWIFMITS